MAIASCAFADLNSDEFRSQCPKAADLVYGSSEELLPGETGDKVAGRQMAGMTFKLLKVLFRLVFLASVMRSSFRDPALLQLRPQAAAKSNAQITRAAGTQELTALKYAVQGPYCPECRVLNLTGGHVKACRTHGLCGPVY